MTTKQCKMIGRPYREPKDGELASMGFRVTANLKRRIQAAANATGHSMSQEIEQRLERSFRDDQIESKLDEIMAVLKWRDAA